MQNYFSPSHAVGTRAAAIRTLIMALAVCVMISTTGCSFFVSNSQSLNVMSEPSGAGVTINGNYIGATPVSTNINRHETAMVQVQLDGYRSASRMTDQRLSVTGVLDIIGGILFLIPLLGLLSDGAFKQEPESMLFNLQAE